MLYSLLGCVIAFAFSTPLLSLYFFKMGVKYGSDKKEGANTPILPRKSTSHKKSAELKRLEKISQNVENYVGDSRNQVEI